MIIQSFIEILNRLTCCLDSQIMTRIEECKFKLISRPAILISDFGECEVTTDHDHRKRTGATGTLEFMPPELLTKDSQGNYIPNHSPSADMWSLGVVLYFICYSCVPYTQIDDVDLLKEEILTFDEYSNPNQVLVFTFPILMAAFLRS